MNALKAHIRDGHIHLDEPTDLPEGAELLLFPSDDVGELEADDLARLHQCLRDSQAQADRGELLDWKSFMAELGASRE